jgi:hypothetical protein
LIDESVLYREIGSRETMREQLEHLTSIDIPQISVQIVPSNFVRFGLLAGFMIATLEGGIEVAYLETAIRGVTTGDQDEVAAPLPCLTQFASRHCR